MYVLIRRDKQDTLDDTALGIAEDIETLQRAAGADCFMTFGKVITPDDWVTEDFSTYVIITEPVVQYYIREIKHYTRDMI